VNGKSGLTALRNLKTCGVSHVSQGPNIDFEDVPANGLPVGGAVQLSDCFDSDAAFTGSGCNDVVGV
jgi:hypothetical protein